MCFLFQDKITNLKYAYLYTLSNDDCRALHESRAPIHDFSTLCAYSGKYGTGVCSGDSGKLRLRFKKSGSLFI